ncbi:MAG: DUF262 domain-containing protein [Candidatus Binataceae bacterium]
MGEIAQETLDELTEGETDQGRALAPLTDNQIEQAYANVSFRVIYQSNNYFLPQIRDLIKDDEVINLRPEYQRRLRWSNKKKSLLIESLLLNIPIPPVFLYESDPARYEVMDGQQRLSAVYEYLESGFELTGLEKLEYLDGRRYNKLPPKLRRGLDRASISAIVLLQETRSDEKDPYLVRRLVFERLNTGGQPLNAQEIRNSIFRGDFNDMIVKLAQDNTFCQIFNIPQYTETDQSEYYENPERRKNSLYKSMADCQIVLRFFALLDDEHISGSMHKILDRCMERNQNPSKELVEQYRKTFVKLIEACNELFEGKAFLLPPDENGTRRVSIPLYDANMVALYRRMGRLEEFVVKRAQIQAKVQELLAEQIELLTGKANTADSIKQRIAAIGSILDSLS